MKRIQHSITILVGSLTLSILLLTAVTVAALETPAESTSGPAADVMVTVNLEATKDNTLYESSTGALSNGEGQHFFAGQNGSNSTRRGLVAFDIDRSIPAGATIISTSLQLHMSKSNGGPVSVDLHVVSQDWGESTSVADRGGGGGAAAANGDATWLHTFFDTSNWTTAGGDFAATPSASTVVGGVNDYQWTSAEMTADVQSWLDTPANDFGWIVIGNESVMSTAKRFGTRENSQASQRPQLTVVYSIPASETVYLPVLTKPQDDS